MNAVRIGDCTLETRLGAGGMGEVWRATHASSGRAVAVKVADGGHRAGQAVLVAALRALGAASEPGVDGEALGRLGVLPVLGHGKQVGRIRPLLP